ncbi:hypothetical protein JN06_00748 [Bacteroides zoogleoformans]|nr:hypothetical protein [Bacteroides zoogleoformans]TWJ17435.1 hypothetical protein JN06_00748 [Bacteroides zoogleoformans]
MKKIFTSVCMMAALTLMATGCSNEEKGAQGDQYVKMTVSIPQLEMTRALGAPGATGNKVTIGGDLTVRARRGANGAVLTTVTIPASEVAALVGGTPKVLSVAPTANYIEVEGNADNATETDDVNTRQGIATSSKVRLTGGAHITPGTPNATCSVTLNPEMARVEVKGKFNGTYTHLDDLKITAIYINNTRVKRGDATPTRVTSNNWNTAYAASPATFYGMYNNGLDGTPGSNTAIADLGANADGYNFFPQKFTPAAQTKEEMLKGSIHMIFKVNYTPKGGVAATGKYLNVVAFKEDGGTNAYISDFQAGKIYQFDLSKIQDIMDDPFPPVTPDPDPETISVELSVTVGAWTVVAVNPEV